MKFTRRNLTAAALPPLAALATLPALPAQASAAGNPVNGAKLYEARCTWCHAVDANRTGPAHRGVYGRKAGSVPGYRYSSALRNAGWVWNERTLDAWLADPEKLLPGTAMDAQITNAKAREDLVAYLKTLKP